jgi:D-amino-acid dehydrogenase
MKIAVVGAGIIGVSTAFELARDGHEVQVFERRAAVAAETSFANAGVLAPGYVTPWAAPGMAMKVLGQMFSRNAAVRLHAGVLAEPGWLWRWWRNCSHARYRANRGHLQRLAHYSRERQAALTQELALSYEQAQGYLVLLRGKSELKRAQAGLALLQEVGAKHQLVDADAARRIEPALSPATALHAAIHLPDDGVGNCRVFAHALKAEAQRLGAAFHFQREVLALAKEGEPWLLRWRAAPDGLSEAYPPTGVPEQEQFDAVVLCAGVHANDVLKPLGVRLPLLPVWGYSVTAPLRQPDAGPDLAPRAGLMDERYKVAISRLGQRVRVAGSAELGGSPKAMNAAALKTLYRVLDDWFPGSAQIAKAQVWKGARPMLPEGAPVIGPGPHNGLWLNLGHGSSGWALACGSARVLADQVAGGSPAIDGEGYALQRYR